MEKENILFVEEKEKKGNILRKKISFLVEKTKNGEGIGGNI